MNAFSSVQSLSRAQLFATPWTAAHQASLSHHQLLELTQTHVHRVGDAIQPSPPPSSPSPPAFNLSQHQGLFQWVSSSHQVAKVLEFQLQHQSFQWILRTDISFRVDWLYLLAVQGTLKSLLQHHSSKASILRCSAFFIVQLLSRIGEGNGIPLQCSCLENPRDRGAWWGAVYGFAQSRTRLKWLSSSSSSSTSVHDYWKNHSFDYMDLCWQRNVSVF